MTIERVRNTLYDLQTFLGDSGSITVSNIPTDSDNYVIYLEINGKEKIEKSIALNGAEECTFDLSASETTSLGVGTFPYGIKICNTEDGSENTYVPDLRNGNRASFTVYPERVAGLDNE